MENKKNKLFALYLLNALGMIFYFFSLEVSFQLTHGTFLMGLYWFILLFFPAIITVLFNSKIWRYIAFILGLLTTIINIIVSIGYLMDNEFIFGLILILYWGILGITASIFSYKWYIKNNS